ncbi:MAG: hypothetical protein IPM29_22845 [Planctomycetes bacterium]|nr:hypothetical protein [Planctomycetota bacterium]
MTMPWCVTWLLAIVAPALVAQEPDDAEAAKVRFSVDAEGRVCVSPDPAAGGEGGTRPIADPNDEMSWANVGALGFLALLGTGEADLASAADADRFFARLGAGDAELLQVLVERPTDGAPRWRGLRRLLAVRACADRGFRPALGVLERIAGDDAEDAGLRQAARESIAVLRGEPIPRATTTLPPLAEVFAAAPIDSELCLVIDQTRLPSPRPMVAWARTTGLAVTRRAIAAAGGTVSAAQWAGAMSLAETPGVLPYELARRYGNQRILRTALAVHLPDDFPFGEPAVWLSLEGRFDVASLRQGLEADEVPFAVVDGGLRITVADGGTIAVTATRVTGSFGSGGDGDRLGKERAERVAALLPQLAVAAVVTGSLPVPEEASGFVPEAIGVDVPRGDDPDRALVVVARFPSENVATAVEGQVRGLPRMLETAIDDGEAPECLAPLLERFGVTRDGSVVTMRLRTAGLDMEALLTELASMRGP